MERFSQLGTDSESESFDRTFRGYVLYATLPFINKIIGISHDNLVDFISHSPISILFIKIIISFNYQHHNYSFCAILSV